MKDKKTNKIIEYILVLLMFTMLSMCLNMRYMAKYTSEDVATPLSRPAKFNVQTKVIAPNDKEVVSEREWSDVINVTVRADSETHTKYGFKITKLPKDSKVVICEGDEESPDYMMELTDVQVAGANGKLYFDKPRVELRARKTRPIKFEYDPNEFANEGNEKVYKIKIYFPFQEEETNKDVNVKVVYTQLN